MTMTPDERRAASRQHLGLTPQLSPQASAIATPIRALLRDAQSLPVDEEARLLAQLSQQISGRLVSLL